MQKTIDELVYDELREVGLHHYLERAIKCRLEYELAKKLESLDSDAERGQLINELGLATHSRASYGLIMNLEKFNEIYIPKKYREFIQHKDGKWDERFIGILSWDEQILTPSENPEKQLLQQVFNETILGIDAEKQMYLFVFDSEWRKNVMNYSKGRLNSIAKDLAGKKPGYKDDEHTKEYVALIEPLVKFYIKEINTNL